MTNLTLERVRHPFPNSHIGGTPVQVWVNAIPDGDSLWVSMTPNNQKDTFRVRIYGIDAPGLDQDYGKEAQCALYQMVRSAGYQLMLKAVEFDQRQRVVGILYRPGGNPYCSLNFQMVQAGHARWHSQYGGESLGLDQAQEAARQEFRGLWHGAEDVAPWDYRLGGGDQDRATVAWQMEQAKKEVRAATVQVGFWTLVLFLGIAMVVVPLVVQLVNPVVDLMGWSINYLALGESWIDRLLRF